MKKNLIFILLIGLIVLVGFWSVFFPLNNTPEEIVFKVERGEGSREISLNLARQGLIRWAPLFRLYVLVNGMAGDLKAGDYLFSSDMNIPEIAYKLASGQVIKINVTIPEGFTQKQIEDRLNLVLPGEELEGFLFPDTYEFNFGFTAEEAVKKMKENFETKLTEQMRQDILSQNKAILEIVTMASLIEKEVISLADKKIVSGVLWKRLSVGMPLQVDATLAYLSGQQDWTFDEMRQEIASWKEIDSPYNTYKYLGLPPGPICNPGLDSIVAAIYPQESVYWYYLSTPEGDTVFNETLAGHNAARARYFK